ncbi:2-C-methyl-D-erythritol 4-phosphate cytidylyltransferase [Desulfotomaculum arcticum]|uniref:2-C-methyl-D-erythritol 4-phosphate cytidylyltransferase n=1 Tax=Desulfotruncus arcticus DSM 17038 TaxID=1121424 RepID=A0A1I2VZI5_9FIRM|nr:2-C-methyl-D-erythritol 4-phosphate cytidylyltransferase [Desulfotruncus arcticus]SFG94564.1 2-C-methyl-D-erythritol 4-phosphate cytidylyltransferase [Desulfotomaculum arcticum] [Desulfotruncus arcticus DSM 17038]
MGSVYAIVPAAGGSTRMGGVNKQLIDLAGRLVVEYSLRVLLEVPVAGIVLVVPPGEEQKFLDQLKHLLKDQNIQIVAGGANRRDSVGQGLLALPAGVEMVIVHDGARPLARREHIQEAVQAAAEWGAATLAVPVKDTVKLAGSGGLVQETLPREELWQVQTPQVFKLPLLLEAHRKAAGDGFIGTDDASLVERLGKPVKLVRGDYSNIKITTPEDLIIAKALLGSGLNQL